MKRLLLISLVVLLISTVSIAQNNRYLVFEFVKVESVQTFDYLEYKEFLGKIYQEALENGDITGWDFWSLQKGPNNENFQYVTITYFDDPVKMMNGISNEQLITLANKVYPEMNESKIEERIRQSVNIRDLAMITYMVEIASSKEKIEMVPGMLASFDLMKAVEGKESEYEKAEREVFLPLHEKKIQAGLMESWSLLKTAFPTGSEAKSTHMTVNIYSSYMQFFNSLEYEESPSEKEQEVIDRGYNSRDQKWIYLATLESVIR